MNRDRQLETGWRTWFRTWVGVLEEFHLILGTETSFPETFSGDHEFPDQIIKVGYHQRHHYNGIYNRHSLPEIPNSPRTYSSSRSSRNLILLKLQQPPIHTPPASTIP